MITTLSNAKMLIKAKEYKIIKIMKIKVSLNAKHNNWIFHLLHNCTIKTLKMIKIVDKINKKTFKIIRNIDRW